MPTVFQVTINNGIPVSGTGTVSTIDTLMGGSTINSIVTALGNVHVNGTFWQATQPVSIAAPVAATQSGAWTITGIGGAISLPTGASTAALQGTVNTLNGHTIDLGSGTGGTGTQRILIDTSQLGSLGAATSANSAPVAMATDSPVYTALNKFGTGYYVTVAASQTAQVLQSSTGATGDYVSGVLVIPASTSPGVVTILDNATSINIFAGGASSVGSLVPFFIPLGAVSRSGAWKLTTGSAVSCVAVGKFS